MANTNQEEAFCVRYSARFFYLTHKHTEDILNVVFQKNSVSAN